MVLGAHNSWSYLPVKPWYLKPLFFTAECQSKTIREQYESYGVRCFDLRVKFIDGKFTIAHGIIQYKCSKEDVMSDLDYINAKGDSYVRVLHEVRNEDEYKESSIALFRQFCMELERDYKEIRFWCGKNLYNWEVDYDFDGEDPSCEEKYASVCPPKLIDDWFPWIFAHLHNEEIKAEGTDKDILLIDFVNIG